MKKQLLILAFLSLAGLAVGCGAENSGTVEVRTKQEGGGSALIARSWSATPIAFYISSTVPDEFVQPILDSFSVWEEAAGKSLFVYMGRSDSTIQRNGDGSWENFDGKNIVYWDDQPSVHGYLGETFYSVNGNRQMNEADIVLYGDPADYAALDCKEGASCHSHANKFDVTTTSLHEIGHFLGLDHTTDEGSIMNPDFGENDVIHDIDASLTAEIQLAYNPTNVASN
jgi:hypothetical protein